MAAPVDDHFLFRFECFIHLTGIHPCIQKLFF